MTSASSKLCFLGYRRGIVEMKISNVFRYLLGHGVRRTAHYGMFRISEIWNEYLFSVDTSEYVNLPSVGINNPECCWYRPISYGSFKRVMKEIEIEEGQDVFVDYGAGKGRVVVIASTHPFKRVIGVELAPELAAIARENVRRGRKKPRCKQIEIVTADASTYSLPKDATVIHLFNPFRGEILYRVTQNIKTSLLKFPRQVTILFANPADFERMLRDDNLIPKSWIKSRREVLWPHREYAGLDKNRYRIYQICPE